MTIRGTRKAFTLVEMLVVGALIALFAGLAIFGVQQQFRSNQRKAVIGESRQLASALDFAYNDIGFFPKIAFLQDSVNSLEIESDRQFGDPSTVFLGFPGYSFQAYSVPVGRDIRPKWRGPYFATSQSRTRVAQGRGGSRNMRVVDNPNLDGWPWPVDTWNNPYMFYSMNMAPGDRATGAGPTLYFTTAIAADPDVPNTSAGATGNFINAVVSYGPNQVPGGGELFVPLGDKDSKVLNPSAGGNWALRLYTGDPNAEGIGLTLLTGLDLTNQQGRQRANAWSAEFTANAGFSTAPGGTLLGLDDDGEEAVGITDPGSDDVVFTF